MKIRYLIIFLSLVLCTKVFGNEAAFKNTFHFMVGKDLFWGDSKGQFKDDPVAILNDGSAWKVHPKDVAKFAQWQPNDLMHIEVRPDWYLFKREHHFLLVNNSRDETVRAMFVHYPSNPYYVKNCITVFWYTSWHTNSWTDANGVTHVQVYSVDHYRNWIMLSDDSTWYCNTTDFYPGEPVYFSCDFDYRGIPSYFIVREIERGVKYGYIYKD